MVTDDTPTLASGSAALVWTLIARSLGLAAGVALALLAAAALLWLP